MDWLMNACGWVVDTACASTPTGHAGQDQEAGALTGLTFWPRMGLAMQRIALVSSLIGLVACSPASV